MTGSSSKQTSHRSDTLASSLVLVIGITVFQRSLGFVREVLFCRSLDQQQLGTWAMAFVFLMSATAIAALGIQGSMNRYLEHYRQRGRLRQYLRRVAAASGLLAISAGTVVWIWRQSFAQLIFGDSGQTGLVGLLAVGLVVVMANHFLIEFFSAMRLFRICTALHFANSFGFVVSSITLMAFWQTKAQSLVVAFCGTYLLSLLGFAAYAIRVARRTSADTAPLSGSRFWPKLARFSCGLWIYNCLANLFEATDRYMIVHFSGLDTSAALATVGNYHSARVVPLLLTSIAALIASTLMPHQSHDWEVGRRERVGFRQRLTLKLVGFGLLAAATVVMIAGPLLFDVIFQGKFDAGRDVLSWVLATCIWSGLSAIAFNYLWCVERLRLCSAALAVALAMNIGLNALLLPMYGLWGAVIATAAANLVQLSMVYLISRAHGLKLDLGTWVITLAPALLFLGPEIGVAMVLVLGLLAISGQTLLQQDEKQQLAVIWAGGARRLALLTRHSRILSAWLAQTAETSNYDEPRSS